MMYLGKEFGLYPETATNFEDVCIDEMGNFLDSLDLSYTYDALRIIYHDWKMSKGWLWNLMSESPYWDGHGRIVIPHEYVRYIDLDVVNSFFYWAEEERAYMTGEIDTKFQAFSKAIRKELEEESAAPEDDERHFNKLANRWFVATVNEYYPEVVAVAGQKVSRILNKVFKVIGLTSHDEYKKRYSILSDAVNPYRFTYTTVVSILPVDYWAMSLGHNWNSCHSIDIHETRQYDHSGFGFCYCAGPMSYMLDGCSVVYYTVDPEFEGKQYEYADRMNRCMFHLGHDKMIQGRTYPNCESAGAAAFGNQVREVMQRLICEAAGVPNLWSAFKRGPEHAKQYLNHCGSNYPDYWYYANVGVSFWKGDGREEVDNERIDIGATPRCLECGEEYDDPKTLYCRWHDEGSIRCAECGEVINEDDVCWINGEPYCADCVTYCAYHEEYEVTSSTRFYDVLSYGTVCQEAIDYSGDFVEVEDPERYYSEYMHINDVLTTDDGRYFRDVYNMMDEGYDRYGHLIKEEDNEEVCA